MSAEKPRGAASPETKKPTLEVLKWEGKDPQEKIEIEPSPTKKELAIQQERQKYKAMVENALREIAKVRQEITSLPQEDDLIAAIEQNKTALETAKAKLESAWFRKQRLRENVEKIQEEIEDLRDLQQRTKTLESTFAAQKGILDRYLNFYVAMLEIHNVNYLDTLREEFPFLTVTGAPKDENLSCLFFEDDYQKIIDLYGNQPK